MSVTKTLLAVAIAVSVCISQNVTISGIVTDTGGTPIEGAAVQLEKAGLPTTTGADGSFTITGTIGIIGHINQPLPHMHIVKINNGVLCINVAVKSTVEITTYTLQGKVISAIQKTMDAGTYSIAMPRIGAGVYFYKVIIGRSEFVIKSHSIGRISAGIAVSVQGASTKALAKEAGRYIPINDVIAVTKDGYLNYRVIVTNSDTSNIEIKMILCAGTVTDIDGNVYQTVKIGNQVWTVENLRTTKYSDGSEIPLVTDKTVWEALITPGYCYYNNMINADSIKKFGGLYNWYVVDTKKLAPTGWHVPTDTEWYTLQNYLIANGYNWDGTTTENKVAKSIAAKTDWLTDTSSGAIGNDLTKNNKSGFSALPGGRRSSSGSYMSIGSSCNWWCAVSTQDWVRDLSYKGYHLGRYFSLQKNCAFSVRLVKD